MTHVRIFLRCINAGETAPLCFDVAIDRRKAVCGNWLIFGLQGESGDDWYPFVCRHDGVIDFGCERENRWGRTNLRALRVAVGSKVSVWDVENREFVFVIDDISSFT